MPLMSETDRQIAEKRAEERRALRAEDVMRIYGVGKSKAYRIIRSVRMTCGGGRLGAGMILETELRYWEEHPMTDPVARL